MKQGYRSINMKSLLTVLFVIGLISTANETVLADSESGYIAFFIHSKEEELT